MNVQKPKSRRAAARRTVWALAGVYAGIAAAIVSCSPERTRAAAPADDLSVTDARICATVAAYALATGDQWDQRAVIASTTLNRFAAVGHVPDCGQALSRVVAAGVDAHLWQASLDAVDAVLSGSYAIPVACARADTVVRSPAHPAVEPIGLSPVAASAARAQCVIGDLAFVEGGAL